ncbi:protein WVD2-like 7 isoform X2 [Durio zibethinus]|uniref:Protein WVD2-like 7 isoform X2 n=1 Tax=Durio zibethinus TaxID=66656 RepID=A0A6P6B8M7_DURZI|nr:protein WVD2-like 7 isoform X2 [Durio zibethinus]
MAAEIETRHSFCSNNNNNNTCSSYHHLLEELSTILDHGSISFGRYAGDSIAWEKWSVFTHNRCQEELEKFKAPGLVAQKKAYFEEYYKYVRAMKELPAHQQETCRSDPSQETQENTTLIGNGIDAAVAEKEDKLSNVSQIQILDNAKAIHLNPNNLKPSCKEAESCSSGNNHATIKEGPNVSTNIVEAENYFGEASVPCSPLLDGNSESVQQNSIAFGKMSQTINEPRKHGTLLEDKGTVAFVINKAKVSSITTKDAVMKSKPKPCFQQQATVKVNKSVPSRKKSTSNAVGNINRQITEPHSSFPRLCVLSARGRVVSSSSSSSIRKAEAKPSSNSQHSRTKLETKLLIQIPNVQVTRLASSTSTSSIRKAESKPSSNSQHSRNKLETRLPVLSRSAKSISENIALTDGLRNMAHDGRKSSEWSKCHMRSGVEESTSQRSKVKFRNLYAQEKSNNSIGVERFRSYNKELKQEEGKDKIHVGLRRDAKHTSTLLSRTNRVSVQKLAHKAEEANLAVVKVRRGILRVSALFQAC